MRQHRELPEQTGPDAGRPASPRRAHPLIDLQQSAGNAAISRQVQRMMAAPAAATVTKQQQIDALATLVAFYVPEEAFAADGAAPPLPTHASVVPQQNTDTEALLDQTNPLPRVNPRGSNTLVQSWQGQFHSEYFVYRIELINTPGAGTGVDTGQAFRVTRRTPKRTMDQARSRTFAYQERWMPNLAYWQQQFGPGAPVDQAAVRQEGETKGLPAAEYLAPGTAVPAGFRQLPHGGDDPFVFFAQNRADPNHPADARQFMNAAQFDQHLANPPAGHAAQSMRLLSTKPQVGRQAAARNPQQAMGGFSAHAFVPGGRPGAQGQLSSHEWCHLIGDGDGGPAALQNLVIGSNAVNTEQLAMESALRKYVPRLRTLGYSIQLLVTAITTDPAAAPPNAQNAGARHAQAISYQIGLVTRGNTDDPNPEVVHRQIMDANRGTMTTSEFTFLHNTVAQKLSARAVQLQTQAAAAQQGT